MLRLFVAAWLTVAALHAAELRGQVEFGGLPVPGASVAVSRAGEKFAAITDTQGSYSFPNLAEGTWEIRIEMLCFAAITQDVIAAKDVTSAKWELQLLPLDAIQTTAAAPITAAAPTPPAASPPTETKPTPPANDLAEQAADGLLVNGSMNNGASTPFAQAAAFGNMRQGPKSLYTGSIGVIVDNSALDARSYSLTGQDTAKPAYDRVQAVATLGGVLKIPHLMPNGPFFFVGYQWSRDRNATTQTSLVPDASMRAAVQVNPQARALLNLYPLPNFDGSGGYNYQVALVGIVHQDALQSRLNKTFDNRNQLYGGFAFESTRADNPSLFGFLDTADTLGINTSINWQHQFRPRLYGNLGFQFSRLASRTTPFFANRENVSGHAGIAGNDQDPADWGPPTLVFSSGIASLTDAPASFDRNQTSAVSYAMLWSRGRHNLTFGGDYRRQQFNYLSQQNPRGTFTFTGAATGSDFNGFLAGIPDTSTIAFGNADKYFRGASYDGYVTDDLRVSPELTINAGLRWEYSSPVTELYGRLVNLEIAPGFTAATPAVARDYPDPLIHPDKHAFEPRIGIAWRPVSGSSLVVRAGYGIDYNTSVYQPIALQMAQQAPLSKSLSVQNSPADPLTLANGFNASPATTQDTFAIDPNFRIGYAQNWKLALQRDLPGSLVLTATYLGVKGTRGMQEFLPNTFPAGAADPCPACPRGFAYLASNGNSTRESGQIQLRRRLHNGLTATLQYTYAKSIDDSALGSRGQGGAVIAQNWLDLRAERGLSTFDQRHLVNAQLQYTTAMGLGGGALLSGWKGALFKEWSISTQITAGSGLPLTPVYLTAVTGTGVTGSIRPDYTGAPPYAASPGLYLNPAAYTAPAAGEWGNAGRDSITGPGQFVLNASLGRTFRWRDRFHIDLRFDAANALNHVSYASWYTTVGSPQFGLPTAANAMRTVQSTLRLRF